MEPTTQIDDAAYVKALAHPVRVRILAMLEEETASPKELARRLGASLGAVAYHVRTLANLGLIELVDTQPRRGATEHYYRAVPHPGFSDEAWDALGPVGKQRMLSAALSQLMDYVQAAAAAGGFDRADAHFSRTAMKLDEKGWHDLAAATKRWLAQAERIEEASARRLAKRGAAAAPMDVGLGMLLFEAVPFSRRQPSPDGAGPPARPGARGRAPRPASAV